MIPNAPSIYVDGQELDPASVALPLIIRQGRSGTDTQPDAPSCEFTWLEPTVPFGLADPVQVALELPISDGTYATWGDTNVSWGDSGYTWAGLKEGAADRYGGQVTGIVALERDGDVYGWDITCTGNQSLWGWTRVRLFRPAETDVERVQAIATAAGRTITVSGTDPVPLVADNIDTDALSALHEVCNSSAGMTFEGRDGTQHYGTRGFRALDATVQVPNSAILDGIEWRQDRANIVNHVVVAYGYEGSQPPPAIWNYRTGAPTGDPGSGSIEGDGTTIALSRYAASGTDSNRFLQHLKAGDSVRLQSKTDSEDAAAYQITTVTDNGSWWLLAVSVVYVEGGGLGQNEDVIVEFDMASTKTQNTYLDQDSINAYGFHDVEIDTLLTDSAAANEMGYTILLRRKDPYWLLPGVLVNSADCTDAAFFQLNDMYLGAGAVLQIPVIPGPVGDAESWTVEGWVEQWDTFDVQQLQIAVSDRQRWGAYALNKWVAVAGFPWSYFVPMSWLDALSVPLPVAVQLPAEAIT